MHFDLHFIRRKIKLIQEIAHFSFDEISKDRIKFLALLTPIRSLVPFSGPHPEGSG
jgi:hypothetical protein